jgi:hypothetical protein
VHAFVAPKAGSDRILVAMIRRGLLVVLLACVSCAVGGSSARAVTPSHHWSVGATFACLQPASGNGPADCSPHATLSLGSSSVALLQFATLTPVQSDAIQDAQLHLRLLGPAPLPAVRLLLYRIENYWHDGDQPSLTATWESAPIATAAPAANGAIDVDVTAQVDDWRRHEASGWRDGRQNNGFAIRVVSEDPQAPAPAVELASPSLLDPGLRPALETTTWESTWSSDVTAVPGPFDVIAADDVALSISTVTTYALSGRFQYLASGMTHWTGVPASALRDEPDGPARSSADIPLEQYRSHGAIWDVSGIEHDGLVRVRALVDGTYPFSGGATDETSFVLDRPDVPGPDPRSSEPGPDPSAPTEPPGAPAPPVGATLPVPRIESSPPATAASTSDPSPSIAKRRPAARRRALRARRPCGGHRHSRANSTARRCHRRRPTARHRPRHDR